MVWRGRMCARSREVPLSLQVDGKLVECVRLDNTCVHAVYLVIYPSIPVSSQYICSTSMRQKYH